MSSPAKRRRDRVARKRRQFQEECNLNLAPGASVTVGMECDYTTGKCVQKSVSKQVGSANICKITDDGGRTYKMWTPRDGICYAEDAVNK